MHRIDSLTADPNHNGTGKTGFRDGTPPLIAPTRLNAKWFNAAQEEIAGAVEGMGLALDGTDFGQLLRGLELREILRAFQNPWQLIDTGTGIAGAAVAISDNRPAIPTSVNSGRAVAMVGNSTFVVSADGGMGRFSTAGGGWHDFSHPITENFSDVAAMSITPGLYHMSIFLAAGAAGHWCRVMVNGHGELTTRGVISGAPQIDFVFWDSHRLVWWLSGGTGVWTAADDPAGSGSLTFILMHSGSFDTGAIDASGNVVFLNSSDGKIWHWDGANLVAGEATGFSSANIIADPDALAPGVPGFLVTSRSTPGMVRCAPDGTGVQHISSFISGIGTELITVFRFRGRTFVAANSSHTFGNLDFASWLYVNPTPRFTTDYSLWFPYPFGDAVFGLSGPKRHYTSTRIAAVAPTAGTLYMSPEIPDLAGVL